MFICEQIKESDQRWLYIGKRIGKKFEVLVNKGCSKQKRIFWVLHAGGTSLSFLLFSSPGLSYAVIFSFFKQMTSVLKHPRPVLALPLPKPPCLPPSLGGLHHIATCVILKIPIMESTEKEWTITRPPYLSQRAMLNPSLGSMRIPECSGIAARELGTGGTLGTAPTRVGCSMGNGSGSTSVTPIPTLQKDSMMEAAADAHHRHCSNSARERKGLAVNKTSDNGLAAIIVVLSSHKAMIRKSLVPVLFQVPVLSKLIVISQSAALQIRVKQKLRIERWDWERWVGADHWKEFLSVTGEPVGVRVWTIENLIEVCQMAVEARRWCCCLLPEPLRSCIIFQTPDVSSVDLSQNRTTESSHLAERWRLVYSSEHQGKQGCS